MKLKFTLEIETEDDDGVTESQAAVLMLDALNESFPSCITDEDKDIVFCVKTWYFEQVENDDNQDIVFWVKTWEFEQVQND